MIGKPKVWRSQSIPTYIASHNNKEKKPNVAIDSANPIGRRDFLVLFILGFAFLGNLDAPLWGTIVGKTMLTFLLF